MSGHPHTIFADAHFALQQGLIGHHSMGREKAACFCLEVGGTTVTVGEGRKLMVVMLQKTAAFGNSPKAAQGVEASLTQSQGPTAAFPYVQLPWYLRPQSKAQAGTGHSQLMVLSLPSMDRGFPCTTLVVLGEQRTGPLSWALVHLC